MSKGLFTSDFLVGLTIFMVALLIIGPMWNSLNYQVENNERSRMLSATALSASDQLLRTKGSPENWNNTNVRSIGLADELRILNINKTKYFFEFIKTNYTDAKFMLGAGAYEMKVEILDKTGSPITYEGTIFANGTVPAQAKDISNTQRIVILKYNGTTSQIVNLKLALWQPV